MKMISSNKRLFVRSVKYILKKVKKSKDINFEIEFKTPMDNSNFLEKTEEELKNSIESRICGNNEIIINLKINDS